MKQFRRAAALLALCMALLSMCVLAAGEAADSEAGVAGISVEAPEADGSETDVEAPGADGTEADVEAPGADGTEADVEAPEADGSEADVEAPGADGTEGGDTSELAEAAEGTGRGGTLPVCKIDRTRRLISVAYPDGTSDRELRVLIMSAMTRTGVEARNVFLEEGSAQDMEGGYWFLDLTELAAVTVDGAEIAYAEKREDGVYVLREALNVPARGSCYFDGKSYKWNESDSYAVQFEKGVELSGSVSITTGFAAVAAGEKLSLSGDSVMRDPAGNPAKIADGNHISYIVVRGGGNVSVAYEDPRDDTSDSVALTVTRGDVKDTYEAAFQNHKAVFSLTAVKDRMSLEAKAGIAAKRIKVSSAVSGSRAFQDFVTVSPSAELIEQGDTTSIVLSVYGPVSNAREVLINVEGADVSVDYANSNYVFARNYADNVLTVRHGTWSGQSLVLNLTAAANAESVRVTVTDGGTLDCSVFSFFTAQRASEGGCEIGLTLENDAGENQDAVAVVATYDESNRMTAVRVASAGELKAEATEELKLLFDGAIEADHWKVFVYDPATSQPLARAAVSPTE